MTLMPPQHGKSQLISRYFPAWYLGQYPDDHFLHASYEADFAKSWGAKARDIFNEYNKSIFGVELSKTSSSKGHWEILGKHEGEYNAFGMNGSATGKKGDAVNIDDPHKNRLEASSETYQQRVYDVYTDAIETRLSKKGIINITMTPWDVNDLRGRILDKEPFVYFEEIYQDLLEGKKFKDEWVILKFPAIAETNDILGRKEGEALCPELHPLEDLKATKKRRTAHSWSALYQCNPIPLEGNMFKYEFFKIIPKKPDNIKDSIRWWDLAGTRKPTSAYTAGVLGHKTELKDLVISHSIRYKESPGVIRKKVYHYGYYIDGMKVKSRIPLDPGQAAIDQKDLYEEKMKGIPFKAVPEKPMGDKEARAENVATHGELHTIYIVEGEWNDEFIDECVQFPNGKYKDQVDSLSALYHLLFHPESNDEDIDYDRFNKLNEF